MEQKKESELPVNTDIIKREHLSLSCAFIKAAAAGSLATIGGSLAIGAAYPPAMIPASHVTLGSSMKTLACLTPALISCMMYGQIPENKMPEHLRTPYKAANAFTNTTMNIIHEHGQDILASAHVAGMIYEKFHVPSGTPELIVLASTFDNLKQSLPENIQLPETVVTEESFITQKTEIQHRKMQQKSASAYY
jgi:hypothetical protein